MKHGNIMKIKGGKRDYCLITHENICKPSAGFVTQSAQTLKAKFANVDFCEPFLHCEQ